MANPDDVLIEMRRVGAYVRVAAVCAQTGLEVVFAAPADAGPAMLEAIAVNKLEHMRRATAEAEAKAGGARIRPARGVIA